MKIVLMIVGVLLLVLGLHWIGQGTGIFIWPSNPVMDNQIQWAYFGSGTAVIGALLILFARQR
ncbi:MAG: hypothetical protein HY243_03065 [Proteobacteria bacterium]|nr:hypothetical protein [Pseudomonadota bacterium]